MELNNSPDTIRVLLVDDDEEDYIIIRHLFKAMKGADYTLDWVSSSDEAIAAISENAHDVYLVDYRLDGLTGLDVLKKVKAHKRNQPFILLTGVGDQKIERESLNLAASDYLVKKGLTSDVLARVLHYALGRKEQEKQKIDQLVEVNRTKDEFISIASHQLRTPATTVKQYIAMVMDGFGGELSPKQQNLLEKAYDSNERQLAIINDLLKVAQIDSGSMKITLKHTDVSILLNETLNDFEPQFKDAGITVNRNIGEATFADIDSSAVRMILDNLLENAIKYSEPSTKIEVELSVSGDSLSLGIADQGVGVAYPERLFKKFSRIENKLSTEVGGTGLGLYWAKMVAELHNGDLTYTANTPAGSIFTLIIPVR